jgi:uncharacterized protein
MIKINVKNLLSKEVGYSVEDKIEASPSLEEIILIEPLEIKYRLTKLKDGIIGHFFVRATAKLDCSRCLGLFDLVIDKKFDRQFALNPSGEELPILNYHIDIQDPIREEIILSMPIKNLCNEACKGLCANCGKNLNNENCACHRLT